MKALAALIQVSLIGLLCVSAVSASEPMSPSFEVPLESALAQRAIRLGFLEFAKHGINYPETYAVTSVRRNELGGLSVVFVDELDCQSGHDAEALRSPILFVRLRPNATSVYQSDVNRIVVCRS